MPLAIHHVAIIVSNLEAAKRFYVEMLGFQIMAEHYREERRSWKVDLSIDEVTQLELFTFPDVPKRPSQPEALGLRHLAFAVDSLEQMSERCDQFGISMESIRVDEYTGKRFFFVKDPDDLPIEFYER